MILQPPLAARAAAVQTPRLPLFMASATHPFAVVALLFYCARIYSRMVPSMHLFWDDYVITLGVVRPVELQWARADCSRPDCHVSNVGTFSDPKAQ